MKSFRILIAIALAVAMLASVESNSLSRARRQVPTKAIAAAPVAGKTPAVTVTKALATAPKLAASATIPLLVTPPMSSWLNPLNTMLPNIVSGITDYSLRSTGNPTLDNFVNAISKTKGAVDPSGELTPEQQDIFANDLVKAMAELTGVPSSVETEILGNVKTGLTRRKPHLFSVVAEVAKYGDSFTNKETGVTAAQALMPLSPPRAVSSAIAPVVTITKAVASAPKPSMPNWAVKPTMSSWLNPLNTMLPYIVSGITDYTVRSTGNPTQDNFVNAISKTKGAVDSSGELTPEQQDIFANDLVKAMAELTVVPISVQTEILGNVKTGLMRRKPHLFSVVAEVAKFGDSFTNKDTGVTAAKALMPLFPSGLTASLAGMSL